MARRVFVLPFGGAVGAMLAFDGREREINGLRPRRLGLGDLLRPGAP